MMRKREGKRAMEGKEWECWNAAALSQQSNPIEAKKGGTCQRSASNFHRFLFVSFLADNELGQMA
jgi:hypothetical protein